MENKMLIQETLQSNHPLHNPQLDRQFKQIGLFHKESEDHVSKILICVCVGFMAQATANRIEAALE